MISENELIDMLFDNEPLSNFEKVFKNSERTQEWEELLGLCYWEYSYECVGGDDGYMDDPPINHERSKYLKELILFLEENGIKTENTAPKAEPLHGV